MRARQVPDDGDDANHGNVVLTLFIRRELLFIESIDQESLRSLKFKYLHIQRSVTSAESCRVMQALTLFLQKLHRESLISNQDSYTGCS